MSLSRRQTLAALGATAFAPLVPLVRAAEESGGAPHIATNTYPWGTFAKRAKQPFKLHSDELLADIAACGISGYEPIINSPKEFDGLGERLAKHKLEMRSLYVNSTLHDEAKAGRSIATVLAIAKGAKKLGTQIIVTNPSPIRWGGAENKSDEQLKVQALALDELGRGLLELGMTLAYHNHDAELRLGGREFHHMLTATDPENVKFCLDSHWVFRGCGDSEVAVFDAVTHYSERVVELHLRQSTKGAWDEVFSMRGDIDYGRLFDTLASDGISPHFVLEQAVEGKSPNTLSAKAAHTKGRANLEAGADGEK